MSDDEAIVAPKQVAPCDSDSEEEALAPRPRHADPNDEDAVAVKSTPAAGHDSGSDSDADTHVVVARRPTVDSDGEDDEANVTVAPSQLTFVRYDYDAMTYEEFVASLKAKPKKDRLAERQAALVHASKEKSDEENIERPCNGQGGYTFSFMLRRAYDAISHFNPSLEQVGSKVKLPMPIIERSGTKKTAITNFKTICSRLNRTMEEVKDFIEKHLTTQSSIDSNNCLIIKIQNVKQTQAENAFQKYIEEHVKCNMCGGIDTVVSRDPSSRLLTLLCNTCTASRTVQTAGAATYQAQTTKRARQRNKQY